MLQQAGSGLSAHPWALAHAVPFQTIFPSPQQERSADRPEVQKEAEQAGWSGSRLPTLELPHFPGVRYVLPGFGEPSPPPPLLRVSRPVGQCQDHPLLYQTLGLQLDWIWMLCSRSLPYTGEDTMNTQRATNKETMRGTRRSSCNRMTVLDVLV